MKSSLRIIPAKNSQQLSDCHSSCQFWRHTEWDSCCFISASWNRFIFLLRHVVFIIILWVHYITLILTFNTPLLSWFHRLSCSCCKLFGLFTVYYSWGFKTWDIRMCIERITTMSLQKAVYHKKLIFMMQTNLCFISKTEISTSPFKQFLFFRIHNCNVQQINLSIGVACFVTLKILSYRFSYSAGYHDLKFYLNNTGR